MTINPNEVHIWFVDLSIEANNHNLIDLLSEDEYERSCRFAFSYLKNRFTAARAVLRLILSFYTKEPAKNLKFYYDKYGKPMLAESDKIKFNLSHSGKWAVYAISFENEIGIDIEQIREDFYSVDMEQLCLSIEERKILEKLSFSKRVQTFYSLWTYKEALLKGLGCGLEYPLTELEIDISSNIAPKIKTYNLSDWELYQLSLSK